MFAVLAAVCFFLAMLGTTLVGSINVVYLGFFFIALELLFTWRPWTYYIRQK